MTQQQETTYNNFFNSFSMLNFGINIKYDLLMNTIREIQSEEPKEATEQETKIRLFDTVCAKYNKESPMTLITIMDGEEFQFNIYRCIKKSGNDVQVLYFQLDDIEHYHIQSCSHV